MLCYAMPCMQVDNEDNKKDKLKTELDWKISPIDMGEKEGWRETN